MARANGLNYLRGQGFTASELAARFGGLRLGAKLISVSSQMMAARLGGAVAGFAVQLLLARLLTVDGLGLFFWTTSMAAIASLIAARGYPSVAARFIARYEQRNQRDRLHAFVAQAKGEALATAVGIALLISMPAVLFPNLGQEVRYALLAASLSIPALTALAVNGAMAVAVRRFQLGILPEVLVRPILFLSIIAFIMLMGFAPPVWAVVLVLTLLSVILATLHSLRLAQYLPKSVGRGYTFYVFFRRPWNFG